MYLILKTVDRGCGVVCVLASGQASEEEKDALKDCQRMQQMKVPGYDAGGAVCLPTPRTERRSLKRRVLCRTSLMAVRGESRIKLCLDYAEPKPVFVRSTTARSVSY